MADSAGPESSSSGHNYSRSVNWFQSLKRYVQETDVSSLNLSDMELKPKEVASILEILAGSHVTELSLSNTNLKDQMKFLYPLLMKTRIRKLNVSSCQLGTDDVLRLMMVLKNTCITELDISKNSFDLYDGGNDRAFVLHFVQSHLTALNLDECFCFNRDEEAMMFFQALPNTAITHLNLAAALSTSRLPRMILSCFNTLKHTLITHLNLSTNYFSDYIGKLGDSLRDSKLVELDLSNCGFDDQAIDCLLEALIGTKITTLNLAHNFIRGQNNLGRLLKRTQIRNLDLSGNHIEEAKMFSFPHFLKGSSVVSLNLYECWLPEKCGVKLMKSLKFSKLTELNIAGNFAEFDILVGFGHVVKHTNITKFDFSGNYVFFRSDCGELALDSFGELLIGSKLKDLDISQSFNGLEDRPLAFAQFLEKIRHSSVTSLNMSFLRLNKMGAEIILPCLANSQLTHFDFSYNLIENGILSLASKLKLTGITHLNLENCAINDEGAEGLAECLKDTQVTDLNLSHNLISSRGASALAVSIKDANIRSLKLNENKIENDGLGILAEHLNATLITALEVNKNPGNRYPVEEVVWNNRRLAHQVVSFFERVASESGDSLRFEEVASAADLESFLEECLSFYTIVLERPSAAVSVLAREESVSLSKDQITSLLRDEFPKQFTWFVVSKIEADVSEHVHLLKRAEGLGLNTIVELLLLNRPVYTIDEPSGILHPFVYKLLSKYKLPVCNLDVEPQGLERIIEYFTENASLEGAADVISVLKVMSRTTTKENKADTLFKTSG